MLKTKIIFTGGHHNSSLAVIDYLQNHSNSIDIVWVGRQFIPGTQELTQEYKDLQKRNIKFYNIHAGKLYRTTSPKYFHQIIINLIKIPLGLLDAFVVLNKERPQIIVSFGGYLAVPVSIIGKLFSCKVITHEQTTVLGLSNKIISTVATKILTSWPINYYNEKSSIKNKMVYVGLPINPDLITNTDKVSFNNDLKTIYVTGGELGSKYINELIYANFSYLISKYNIIWSYGSYTDEKLDQLIRTDQHANFISDKYFEYVPIIYNSTDLVICRGGAHTIYELALKKKPAIVIPIPWSSNNEQYKNTEVLVNMGLGALFDQEKNKFEELPGFIERVLNKIKIDKIADNLVPTNGETNVSNEIFKLIKD